VFVAFPAPPPLPVVSASWSITTSSVSTARVRGSAVASTISGRPSKRSHVGGYIRSATSALATSSTDSIAAMDAGTATSAKKTMSSARLRLLCAILH